MCFVISLLACWCVVEQEKEKEKYWHVDPDCFVPHGVVGCCQVTLLWLIHWGLSCLCRPVRVFHCHVVSCRCHVISFCCYVIVMLSVVAVMSFIVVVMLFCCSSSSVDQFHLSLVNQCHLSSPSSPPPSLSTVGSLEYHADEEENIQGHGNGGNNDPSSSSHCLYSDNPTSGSSRLQGSPGHATTTTTTTTSTGT